MSCCPDDMEPARAADAHASTTIQVGNGTTIYRAGPPTARVGLLALPDIFGLDSGRAKQDADRLGELGYAVAFVDLADGEYMYEGRDMNAWKAKQDYATVSLPRIRNAIEYLQKHAQVQVLACYGYCWGAWVGARVAAEPGPLVRGHIAFHPSWRAETALMGEDGIPNLTRRILAPQLLLSAGNEIDEVKEGGIVQKLLAEHEDETIAKRSRVVDFPDVKHGWVNRGDLNDPVVRASVERAWTLAREFLQDVTAP